MIKSFNLFYVKKMWNFRKKNLETFYFEITIIIDFIIYIHIYYKINVITLLVPISLYFSNTQIVLFQRFR